MQMEQTQLDPTRERLLDEAEKLFAHKGFDGVSVREITAKAGSHLSAVNYHFGSKKNLYLSVFEERWIPRAKQVVSKVGNLDANGELSVEQVVHTLAEAFLRGFGDPKVRHMHHQLIHREMTRPTEALNLIAEQVTKPFFMHLKRLVRNRTPAEENGEDMFLCMFSVFAQIIFFNFGRNMVSLLTGRDYDQAFQDQVVDHITNFSLYGLNGRLAES
jgi:AcrR family transcriptional regulator